MGPEPQLAVLPLLQALDWCFPYAAPYTLVNDFRLLSCGPRVIVVFVGYTPDIHRYPFLEGEANVVPIEI